MKLPLEYMTAAEWRKLEATGMAYELYPEGPPKKFAEACPACVMEPIDGWCPYHRGGSRVSNVTMPINQEYSVTIQGIPTAEQAEVLSVFCELLMTASRDGGKKRAAGLKPSWKVDPSHWPAVFSHLNKYMHGERVDADSGAHPLVHLAWRALAVAYQETR